MASARDPRDSQISELVRQNPSKRGLAIIITNDYSTSPFLSRLNGTNKDGKRMELTFSKLNIITKWERNVTSRRLHAIMIEVAGLQCPSTYNSISFVFSGHGGENDVISMEDDEHIAIQDIVDYLAPINAPQMADIPKLFFIDACRGAEEMCSIGVSTKAGGYSYSKQSRRFAPKGNTLIAYSTICSYASIENENGGVWIKYLADRMGKSTDSIEDVLRDVRADLHEVYQDPEFLINGEVQMPETISTLRKAVYLNPPEPRKHSRNHAALRHPAARHKPFTHATMFASRTATFTTAGNLFALESRLFSTDRGFDDFFASQSRVFSTSRGFDDPFTNF